MAEKGKEYSSVSIPMPLYNKLKELIEHTGFRSVSEYTIFLLRESVSVWSEESEKGTTQKAIKSKRFNTDAKKKKAAEKLIKKKLEQLGYL